MPIVLKSELCNMKLIENEDFKQHIDSENHMNGTDDAQNVPSGVLVSDDLPKCSLCGITFDSRRDFETHSLSLEHAKKVLDQNSLIALPSDTFNILTSPLESQSEKMCVDVIDKQKQQDKSSSKGDSDLPEKKAFKPPVSSYSCNYCLKEFTGPEPYKQHMESKYHKKKVALDENNFDEIKRIDGLVFCDICKKEFTGEKPYNEHLISKKHRNMEQHFQFFEKNTDEDSAPKAKKIKIESKSEIDKKYFCDICKKQCSGPVPYDQHCAGKDHKKNLGRSQAGVNIKPSINQLDSHQANNDSINCVNIVAKNSSDLASSEIMEHNLQFLSENSDDYSAPKNKKVKIELSPEKQWFCEICRKQCSGPVPYDQHCSGKDHKKNMARSQAGVNIEPSVSQLYTLPPNNSNIDHVNITAENVSDPASLDNVVNIRPTLEKMETESEESKMEIDESKPAWFCRDCNVQCTGPVAFSFHLGGKSHKKKLDMNQKGNDCSKPNDSVDCEGTKSNVYGSTGERALGSQKQEMFSENIDYESELKKSIEIYSPEEKIKF